MDPINDLTNRNETEFDRALSAAIDDAAASFDFTLVSAILFHADEEGASDHERDQLATTLGTDENELPMLADALDRSSLAKGLASFFAAVAALAAGSVGHVLNPNNRDATDAHENAVRSFRSAFLAESTIAIRETAERMLHAIGSADTRAAQIRRVIGLSSTQARSLDAIRKALHTAIATGNKADPAMQLAYARGNLSAAQSRMLEKALRNGVTPANAEALLDRHAKAIRNARVKAVAGNGAHQIAETAKLTGWHIAQFFGALSPNQRRYWQTAGDEKVRHAHAQVPGMNRNGVPLNQPFATPLGQCFVPPLEYGCRCKATLRRGA
jgi:hypothetical protein